MDPRLLKYYNRELQHLREIGGEFAKEYPKIASRLSLDGFECADPYVERLLEGFSFLAARVQLKLDAEFPRFTQHLLEMVYPHYLAPTPSMAVVQMTPDPKEGVLVDGFKVKRDSVLRSILGKGEQTPCEYRTGHELTLWPIEIVEASYFNSLIEISSFEGHAQEGVKAGVRLRIRTTAGVPLEEIALDRLNLFLRGGDEVAMHLYEQMLGRAVRIVARPPDRPTPWQVEIEAEPHLHRVGFNDDEALLPYGARSFQGYRLLHEYFAFPPRFMFVEISGLSQAFRKCAGDELDIFILLDESDPVLENNVDASQFALHCTPAINLFPKRADRVHLSEQAHEYHIVPDRTRPMDFEVYEVLGVTGHGSAAEVEQEFLPFYAYNDLTRLREHNAFFSIRRTPRVLSSNQRRFGPRSSYIGSEAFISLVDAAEAPFRSDLRQLSIETLCTNRDLPLHMSVAVGATDFTLQSAAPVEMVRCVAGPTKPAPSEAHTAAAWRLVSHLSLNYLSILDSEVGGAAAMRELLNLYGGMSDATTKKQVDGLLSVKSRPIHRWIHSSGPSTFGRGLEISIEFDESAFAGSGCFLLGAVLERFFAKYVSINSFTETVVNAVDRGEVIRWPTRIGLRHLV